MQMLKKVNTTSTHLPYTQSLKGKAKKAEGKATYFIKTQESNGKTAKTTSFLKTALELFNLIPCDTTGVLEMRLFRQG